jgi:hypothetical protein
MSRLQALFLPLVYAPRRGEVHCRLVEVMSCTVARWHASIHGPLRWPQPRTPVSGTTSDARITARLECRYGDMTQSRLTCPVIRSGDGRRAGTARLGREPTTYRLICVHDSVAAYSHLTRRTTDLARGDMRGGDSDVGDAGQDSVRVGSSTRVWSKTSGARRSMLATVVRHASCPRGGEARNRDYAPAA